MRGRSDAGVLIGCIERLSHSMAWQWLRLLQGATYSFLQRKRSSSKAAASLSTAVSLLLYSDLCSPRNLRIFHFFRVLCRICHILNVLRIFPVKEGEPDTVMEENEGNIAVNIRSTRLETFATQCLFVHRATTKQQKTQRTFWRVARPILRWLTFACDQKAPIRVPV